ncbi:MAG: NADH-quinone oxidoreductase subunit I [Proteobacteria bacterium]|nr:NADH-quinone oxidoreductase subunit I [Pseudomonadota bacterium]
MSLLWRLLRGAWSLVLGLGVTLRNLFRRPVTETYPHRRPEMTAAFRGAIALVRFPEADSHDCVACMQCVNICPSACMKVEGDKPEGLKRKRATVFKVDYALCSLCGLCIDVCPTDTLTYSRGYDDVGYRRDQFVYDLLVPFRAGEASWLEQARAAASSGAAPAGASAEPKMGDEAAR